MHRYCLTTSMCMQQAHSPVSPQQPGTSTSMHQSAGSHESAKPGQIVGQLHDLAREVRVGSSQARLADIRAATRLRSRLALSVTELVLQVVHVLLQLLAPVPLPVQLHLQYTCTLASPHWSQQVMAGEQDAV